MTAVIGILNKTGIALAADSAVTVSGANQNKIYNTANKIFTLSKYKPIGIMIYNSANFMSIPWETIIKLYRDYLGKNTFDTVTEYQNDFVNFLQVNSFFTSFEKQQSVFKNFVYWNLDALKNIAQKDLSSNISEDEQIIEIVKNIVSEINKTINNLRNNKEILNSYQEYKLKKFSNFSRKSIEEVFNSIFEGIKFPDNIIDLLIEQYFLHIRSKLFIGAWTGLIFAGFGEKEIYPALISMQIAEVFDGKLRYFIDNKQKIDDNNTGSIIPYAQTDVIKTIIEGINPEIDKTFIKTFEGLISKYNKFLSSLVATKSPEIAEKIENLDLSNLVAEYQKEIFKVKQYKQILPTVETVAILSKEDLAEMAESLIYLTYLKRRISSDEESVGGPIDVAIISKGDGFIWKKRKHYFKPELNKHFFDNYFKK